MSVGPTTLKLGWTNPLTGQFGAHPLLGAVVDLNDAATYTLLSPDGLELSPPERSVVPAGNVRTQGERAARAIYRHNRHARIGLVIGPMSSYAALSSTVRTLMAWLNAPPQIPFCVQWQPPSGSVPVYLDVVACGHDIPQDEADWMRLQLEPVAIELWVRPGLRGDRVKLSNLLCNPGFEAPMGGVGTAATAPVAFSDPFTTTAQYSQIGGGAPSLSPASTYVDVVVAQIGAALLRYYRLDETAGTSVYDIGGVGSTGTTHGSPTQGVAGAIVGDADTAYSFASASSQYVSVPTAGLPSGNAAWSIGAWVKFSANPAVNAAIAAFGTDAAKSRALLYVNSSGQLVADVFGSGTTPGAALSLGTWHFVVATYDGTTLSTYVDGAAYGTPIVPGALSVGSTYANIGSGNGQYYQNGSLDEVMICNAAAASSAVAAIYTAGHSGPSGTLANAMSVPVGATIGFGSPAWGPLQTWQARLRYASSLSATFFLHRTDGNNYLACQVASGGGNFLLRHRVAGVVNTLASATITLTPGAWYWVQLTQFPAPPGDPPYVQATVCYDDNGAVGSQVAGGQIGSGAYDAVTALSGQPAINVGGAALVLGGQASGAGQQVALFGPGGWWSVGGAGATPAGCAWEQNAANTAPVGSQNGASSTGAVMVPVASLGAVRIDGPTSGGWAAYWVNVPPSITLAALQQSAVPVAAGGDALFFSGMVKATGNGAGLQVYVTVYEYDATGAQTATNTTTIASGSGAVPWQAWNWNYGATQATTAYVRLLLRAADSTSSSAGCSVWFDNTQAWDVTATGVAAAAGAMPYCELRSPNSPAQLLVTGLLGDLPAPAALSFGAYVASWPLGSVLNFAIGRAAQASATARLVGSSYGYFGSGGNPLASAVLDAAGYGGFYATAQMNSAWTPRCFAPTPADAPGVYHFFQRFWSGQATANLANVVCRANVLQRAKAWYGDLSFDDELWSGYGAYISPLSAGSTWTVCDAGQLSLPPQALGALTDPARNYLSPMVQWVDNTGGGGSQGQASWAALLPVDGSLLVGVLNNPNNGTVAVSTSWVWAYFDGLLTNRAGAQDGPAWGYSIEAGAQPNPAHAGGGPGTQTTGSININSGADPYLVLDPQVTVAQTGQQGDNQLVGYLADGNAAVLPFAAEIAYYPLYLWPR